MPQVPGRAGDDWLPAPPADAFTAVDDAGQLATSPPLGKAVELAHVTVSPAGKPGSATVALGGWSSMSHPDLLRMSDGSLRAFFGGIRTTNPGETNNALNTATAPDSGTKWTLQPGKAAQATYAYATSYVGAGLAKGGTPISSWAGTPGLGSTTESVRRIPTA